jgi:hypothetical protein
MSGLPPTVARRYTIKIASKRNLALGQQLKDVSDQNIHFFAKGKYGIR